MKHPYPFIDCLEQGSIQGFDWFVATVFLLMNGNVDKAWKFLHKFSTLHSSAYMWIHRSHASVSSFMSSFSIHAIHFCFAAQAHLPPSISKSGIHPVFFSSCHNLELLLQAEVPHVFSAFKMSGFSPALVSLQIFRSNPVCPTNPPTLVGNAWQQ